MDGLFGSSNWLYIILIGFIVVVIENASGLGLKITQGICVKANGTEFRHLRQGPCVIFGR